jgi:SAM-dependent methyltransferase
MPTSHIVQASYDRVAAEYVQRIYGELEHKPLDRELLNRFAAKLPRGGPVCDLGCGPGHVARYLHERGAHVCGIDLSAEMVRLAQQLNPGIEFCQGDMLALGIDDGAWDGVVAFYSIIHIPRPQVVAALEEIKRVLRPAGLLLLAVHIGDEVLHLDEWWGQQVSLDFSFYCPGAMKSFLESVGFTVEELIERDPYPEVEHQSRRAYVFARKP